MTITVNPFESSGPTDMRAIARKVAGANIQSEEFNNLFGSAKGSLKLGIGVVKNLNDGIKNGYVKVQRLSVDSSSEPNENYIWAIPSFAMAGQACGLFSLPPVGSMCILMFHEGLNRPIITNYWFPALKNAAKKAAGMTDGVSNSAVNKAYERYLNKDLNNIFKNSSAYDSDFTLKYNSTYDTAQQVIQETDRVINESAKILNDGKEYTGDDIGGFINEKLLSEDTPIEKIYGVISTATENLPTEVVTQTRAVDAVGDQAQVADSAITEITKSVDASILTKNNSNNLNSTSDKFSIKTEQLNDNSLSLMSSKQLDSFKKLAGDNLALAMMGKANDLFGDQISQLEGTIMTTLVKVTAFMTAVQTVCDLLIRNGFLKNAQSMIINRQLLTIIQLLNSLSTNLQNGISGMLTTVLADASKMFIDGAFNLVSNNLGDLSQKFNSLTPQLKGSISARNSFISNITSNLNGFTRNAGNFMQIANTALTAAGAVAPFVNPSMAYKINMLNNNLYKLAGANAAVMGTVLAATHPGSESHYENSLSAIAKKDADRKSAYVTLNYKSDYSGTTRYANEQFRIMDISTAAAVGDLDTAKVNDAIIDIEHPEKIESLALELEVKRALGQI